jgi:hypothetical protein
MSILHSKLVFKNYFKISSFLGKKEEKKEKIRFREKLCARIIFQFNYD